MRKKILFISRHAPYGSSIAKEALDAVLTAAAYDQDLSLLFMDDGIFQLLPNQQANAIGQKSFASMLPALPLYDVENIFVHLESLQARGISKNELLFDSVQTLDSTAVSALLAQQDHLLSF
ncbi:MAG: sulfurtransferase complex subunit TusC [Cellvibrio sp.]|mgnify:CR=1 FL=1|jgi:tRNA 2-thiouridine synthesizing protein C